MGYSNFLFLKEELSLIAVMLILLVYDLFGSQKSLKYFHPVACVLFLAHTLLNLFPAGTAEAFGGMYVCTPIGSIVKTILNTGTLIVLLQAYNWVNSESVLIRRGEFYLILFSSLLGMYFMISAGNFLLFFIGLETASIPMPLQQQLQSKGSSPFFRHLYLLIQAFPHISLVLQLLLQLLIILHNPNSSTYYSSS